MSRGPGIVKGKTLPGSRVQFAEQVRIAMRDNGLSIERAAAISGFCVSTIKNWRSGRTEPQFSEGVMFLTRLASRRTG